MADAVARRTSLRTAVVWDVLRDALAAHPRSAGRLDVLDAGGGTGGFAVPLAELGHRVTVVDPSPDSLAALERRAAEAGVAVLGVQGDLARLPDAVRARDYDVVVCHSVLEVVDDPVVALAGVAARLAPDGIASVLAANRAAAVVSRALAGHFTEAAHLLTDPDGRWAPGDAVRRRFTPDSLVELVAAAGFRIAATHGIRVFFDLLPGGLLDAEPAAREELLRLEAAASEHPEFRAIATQLHVLAYRE